MHCPVLQEVVRNDGAFDIVYWSICTSKSCNDQDTTWDWIAGMNSKGVTKVGRKRITITSDGALEIQRVRLGDAGQYMCTVKTINHTSPRVHHVTLLVFRDGKFKLCACMVLRRLVHYIQCSHRVARMQIDRSFSRGSGWENCKQFNCKLRNDAFFTANWDPRSAKFTDTEKWD